MAKSITIPKTPKSAYNPKRKVSQLLKAHISNLETMTRKRGGTATKRPKTEAQASAYIATLTEQLHAAEHREVAPAVAPAVASTPPYRAKSSRPKTVRKARTRTVARKTAMKRGGRRVGR